MDKLQTSTMPAAESDSQKLQRLGFVQTYSEAALSKGYEVAGSVYSTTRGYVPAAIEDKVSWGEDKVSEISTQYGAPLVNTVQDKSQQILGIVDTQVRSLGADVVSTAPRSRLASAQPSTPCSFLLILQASSSHDTIVFH